MAKPNTPSKKDRVYKRKRRRRQLTALVFILLAVIGTATILYMLYGFVYRTFFDDTGEKEEFEQMLAPIVALDPAPFSSLDRADSEILLQASIWAALTNEDLTKYTQADFGLYLPVIDISRYANQMFGPSYTLEHHTIEASGITFEYIADSDRYLIPATSQSGSYQPIIETITTSGNTKILLVGYAQTTDLDIRSPNSTVYVSKYMEYVMIRESGEYYLYAIREPESLPTQQ